VFGQDVSASAITADLVRLKFQANKHPPLATSPHSVSSSASFAITTAAQKPTTALYTTPSSMVESQYCGGNNTPHLQDRRRNRMRKVSVARSCHVYFAPLSFSISSTHLALLARRWKQVGSSEIDGFYQTTWLHILEYSIPKTRLKLNKFDIFVNCNWVATRWQ